MLLMNQWTRFEGVFCLFLFAMESPWAAAAHSWTRKAWCRCLVWHNAGEQTMGEKTGGTARFLWLLREGAVDNFKDLQEKKKKKDERKPCNISLV